MTYNRKIILLCFSLNVLFANINIAQELNEEKMIENTEEHYTQVADNYLKYLTEKNLEGILSLYAENASLEDPVGSEVINGKSKIREFYQGAVIMDLELKRIGPVRIASNEIAFPFQLNMEVDGKQTITDIIDVFKFDENGKIIFMRAYWGPGNRRVVEK